MYSDNYYFYVASPYGALDLEPCKIGITSKTPDLRLRDLKNANYGVKYGVDIHAYSIVFSLKCSKRCSIYLENSVLSESYKSNIEERDFWRRGPRMAELIDMSFDTLHPIIYSSSKRYNEISLDRKKQYYLALSSGCYDSSCRFEIVQDPLIKLSNLGAHNPERKYYALFPMPTETDAFILFQNIRYSFGVGNYEYYHKYIYALRSVEEVVNTIMQLLDGLPCTLFPQRATDTGATLNWGDLFNYKHSSR